MASNDDNKGCLFGALLIIGLIVVAINNCSTKTTLKSAMSNYDKGNYEKAYTKFEKIDDLSVFTPTQLYVYSVLAENHDSNKAEELKVKTYNKLTSEEEINTFINNIGQSSYDVFMEWAEEKKHEQEVEELKKSIIGEWVAISPSDFSGIHMTLTEDGYMKFGAKGQWFIDDRTMKITFFCGQDCGELQLQNGKLKYIVGKYVITLGRK